MSRCELTVVNTLGLRSAFSLDRLVGHIVRRGGSAHDAIRIAESARHVLAASARDTVSTSLIRHVVDELSGPGSDEARVALEILGRASTPPLLDARVRLALNHAVDRAAILDRLEVEREDRDDFLAYDPRAASQLLQESGHAAGLALTLAMPSSKVAHSVGVQMVMADLERIGVRLSPSILDVGEWNRRAVSGLEDGHTLFYSGHGLFFVQIGVGADELASAPKEAVMQAIRDVRQMAAAMPHAHLASFVSHVAPLGDIFASVPPLRAPPSRRRMKVWMRVRGGESAVGLVAWFPGVINAARTNYASSLDDLASDTLKDAVDDGACFENLEIMSHGNGSKICMGLDDAIYRTDFDPVTGAPTNDKTRRFLDALKAAMCPRGYLLFTACGQGDGQILRNISKYLGSAITVSGFKGTGVPDGIPLFDAMEPDLHFQNGSAASGP